MIKEVKVPEISENVESGTVVKVLVQVGDTVTVDDVLVEFETDKAVVEIPSPVDGKIVELPATEGMDMRVGDVIARIDTQAQAATGPEAPEKETVEKPASAPTETSEPSSATAAPTQAEPTPAVTAPVSTPPVTPPVSSQPVTPPVLSQPVPAAPSVRRFARELGVDITTVEGSGPGGRISEEDIKAHIKQAKAAPAPPGGAVPSAAADAALPDFSRWGSTHTAALETVRRITAESTTTSWHMVPHVTQFDRADITEVNAFIAKQGPKLAKSGIKLTLTSILTKVCAEALKKWPRFNASIDMANKQIIYKDYIHIGMMVETSVGLLVPVIKNVETLSIAELAATVADMAQRARARKLAPDEMEGGTFSISNQGAIGGTQFTPIVLWPQVAILGVSRAAVEPVFRDGEFQPRTILPLSLSYDHRILDGADAARFLGWICDSLAFPFTMHLG
jgi:pyruvate dehydrogenase E2 component (dihydrolipoamide acetyltransferase)